MRKFIDIIRKTGANVVEQFTLSPRRERKLPIPQAYNDGATGAWLRASVSGNALWRHQSLALREVAAGKNVVVSTGTSSGKSLIFTAPILNELLSGGGKALILYPQKALGGDQYVRMRKELRRAGLSDDLVGEINGGVPTRDREDILDRCSVIMATEDIVSAWMLAYVQSNAVQRFLKTLRFLVIDEAHVLDGIFGTASAYLMRRFRCAHAAANEADGTGASLQILATSATIMDAAEHLELLTGCPFVEIDEKENGAPFHGLTIMHVDGPAGGAAGERMLSELCAAIAEEVAPNAFIAFADSRQGIERAAHYVDRDDVLPYRGGFETADRKAIEAALRDGKLRGVTTTSALELGIDIPQFIVGLNLGVPQTRKALRQRVGRIGRSTPGLFILIAPANEFSRLGGSLREYFKAEVEPSHLYLENRFIQFQAATCLVKECAGPEETAILPTCVEWPKGFAETFGYAASPATRPRDLDQLASLAGDSPHHAYPIRAICDVEYALRNVRDPHDPIGTIERDKALREAAPGATYRHLGRCYRTLEWRTSGYERSIILQPVKNGAHTQPLVTTDVGVSTAAGELIDRRLLESERGLLAEIMLRVCDRTVGYRIGDKPFLYRDLSKTNRHMSSKHREFTTTGIVVRIDDKWFRGDGEQASKSRQAVAESLKAILAREHNIAPAEIRTAHRRIAMCGPGGARRIDDAIVVFDTIEGGLRLTAPLFSDLPHLLSKLKAAAATVPDDAMLDARTIERLEEWHASLTASTGPKADAIETADSRLIIFAPGSQVSVRSRAGVLERTVQEAEFVSVAGSDVLMYRCEAPDGAKAWIAHDQVEPLGNDWRRVLWDPASNDVTELVA